MKTVPTFTATIYVGFRERYAEIVRPIETAYDALQKLADNGGLCVTVTPLHFVYKNGREPGMAVGLINYPRFPEDAASLRTKSLNIARVGHRSFSLIVRDTPVALKAQKSSCICYSCLVYYFWSKVSLAVRSRAGQARRALRQGVLAHA